MPDRVVVYAYVVGDLFHVGHLKALQQAKALGDYLIVGVLTDEGVEAYKRKPIIPLNERMELVANLKCVDDVIEQKGVDPTENLGAILPDIVVHGDDWSADFPGAEYMRSIGRRAIRTKYYEGQSTTKIINKIRGLNA
jgi:rfaE bifunctional protein nucleotidyltransferase chain/domain